ncbi:hypothetical protein H4R26_003915 [Coemansia thaxteri]|uniref:Uncharacterized protein n=1 Tax=Coemansia thaxteri TaxID=2663907 RepID=A0A9W8EI21_9FUNG|nr:hypothetical protein H4R26_003915 [Coemansia thaxteri]KAJ2477738.1 hypothetical protein EV174_004522 [Coemansia sp. RSA 2320]
MDLLFQVFKGSRESLHFGLLGFDKSSTGPEVMHKVIEFLMNHGFYDEKFGNHELEITGTKGNWNEENFKGYDDARTLAEQNIKHFSVMKIDARDLLAQPPNLPIRSRL